MTNDKYSPVTDDRSPVLLFSLADRKRSLDIEQFAKRIRHWTQKKPLKGLFLYRGADLNCRPQGYESCALTS